MKNRTVPTVELFVFIINGHSQKNNEILFKILAILSSFSSDSDPVKLSCFSCRQTKSEGYDLPDKVRKPAAASCPPASSFFWFSSCSLSLQPLSHFSDCFFFQTRYIGSGNSQHSSNFSLSFRLFSKKSIALTDYRLFLFF